MNHDLENLKAILRQLGWSDELIDSVEAEAGVRNLPAFGDVDYGYSNPWRVISSDGADLEFPSSSAVSTLELNPAQ
jgi:hypothetical protein